MGQSKLYRLNCGDRRHQIHVGVEVRIERSHVTPVRVVAFGLTGHDVGGEVVHVRLPGGDHGGHDVAAHVVRCC